MKTFAWEIQATQDLSQRVVLFLFHNIHCLLKHASLCWSSQTIMYYLFSQSISRWYPAIIGSGIRQTFLTLPTVNGILAWWARFLLKYEKNKYVIYRPSSAHIEKNCALGPWPVNNIIYCTPEICQLSNFRQVFNFCPVSVAPKFYPQN